MYGLPEDYVEPDKRFEEYTEEEKRLSETAMYTRNDLLCRLAENAAEASWISQFRIRKEARRIRGLYLPKHRQPKYDAFREKLVLIIADVVEAFWLAKKEFHTKWKPDHDSQAKKENDEQQSACTGDEIRSRINSGKSLRTHQIRYVYRQLCKGFWGKWHGLFQMGEKVPGSQKGD